jgi:hypothetical protein
MLMQTLLTAAFSGLALGVALAAEPASLSGDELRKSVSGKTVYSSFPSTISRVAAWRAIWVGWQRPLHAKKAHPPAANGGSRPVSSASDGRAGWRGRPIATSSPARAIA